MGSGSSHETRFTRETGRRPAVAIIGGGIAGLQVAKQLSGTALNVTLFSDKEYLDWCLGSPRGLAEPDNIKHDCFPLKESLAFVAPTGGPGLFKLQCAEVQRVDAVGLEGAAQTVAEAGSRYKLSTSAGEEPEFDAVVVCTGASYGDMPWKAAVGERRWTDRVATMQAWSQKVGQAKHIVVAGAGIVGVEVAAELGYLYGAAGSGKTITLVGTFLEEVPQLARKAKATLEAYNVQMLPGRTGEWSQKEAKVKVGSKASWPAGPFEDLDCDLLLHCTGLHYNSGLIQSSFSDAVDSGSDRIKCKPSLVVDHPGAERIFACGDIVAVPEGRVGSASPGQQIPAMAAVVRDNLIASLNDEPLVATFEFPDQATESGCLISLGPEDGAGVLPCWMCCHGCCGCCGNCMGNWMAAKLKATDGFNSMQSGEYGKGKTWSDSYFVETNVSSNDVGHRDL